MGRIMMSVLSVRRLIGFQAPTLSRGWHHAHHRHGPNAHEHKDCANPACHLPEVDFAATLTAKSMWPFVVGVMVFSGLAYYVSPLRKLNTRTQKEQVAMVGRKTLEISNLSLLGRVEIEKSDQITIIHGWKEDKLKTCKRRNFMNIVFINLKNPNFF